MRKIVYGILILAMSIMLCSCSGKNDNANDQEVKVEYGRQENASDQLDCVMTIYKNKVYGFDLEDGECVFRACAIGDSAYTK